MTLDATLLPLGVPTKLTLQGSSTDIWVQKVYRA